MSARELPTASTSETTEAVVTDVGRAAAREMIAQYEAENGPLPTESRERARRFLAAAGLK